MPSPDPHLVTRPLREARARVVEALGEIADRVGALGSVSSERQRATLHGIVDDVTAHLRPHLEWEERTVHPIVDKYACEGPAVFSASMRYEHEVIYRWLSELRGLADGDAVPFARRADNLLGVVLAHFELEEQVLFPVLDRSMSPAAFGAHVGAPPGLRR